jgi:hypothetical protein
VNNGYQTWTVIPVTRTVAITKMPIFTNAEFAFRVRFLQWKFSRCIEGISSISGSKTTVPTCV